MLRPLYHGLLALFLLLSTASAVIDIEFPRCNCDGEGFWSIESILQCQKVSDFLIATAYFSIPLELLYFVSCSNFPFKWVLFQFGAFIVLCGLTHLFNMFTYEPHSFLVMLSLTISKFLTALVSFATAITLLTLIPQLLRVKVRENFLRNKAHELDREVGMMKRQKAASWHVRMLTQEIRKSLDRHTILDTTMVELSKTLELQNCAVWMLNDDKTKMNLTHELRQRISSDVYSLSIPVDDPDVSEINENPRVKILMRDSLLALKSSGEVSELGEVAAIRMPMLRVSNFKGGTPEMIEACYAILVLVLPRDDSRVWGFHELEIVEVVADQVAVALSHAAVLEESQLMRDELVERNRALQQAKTDAMMASKARNLSQGVMSQGMRGLMHSILGLLSMMQEENLGPEQKLIIDTMAKTSSATATLVDDILESSANGNESLGLEMRPFRLPSMIRTVATVTKSLCVCRNFGFNIQLENELPDHVVGDEKRIIQVIMHVVGNLFDDAEEGLVTFQVRSESQVEDGPDHRWVPWKASFPDGYTSVRFEIGIRRSENQSLSSEEQGSRSANSEGVEMALNFDMCKKLVQMMQGNIWVVPNSQGFVESMILVLRFQLQPLSTSSEFRELSESNYLPSHTLYKGLRVLLADNDGTDKAVIQKLLEKIGCCVYAVSSGLECLNSLSGSRSPFDLVILDIHMHDMDGFELAMRIRKSRSGSWPLIVALTSTAQEDIWERCLQSGMVGVIQKPVMLQGIVDELRRILCKT